MICSGSRGRSFREVSADPGAGWLSLAMHPQMVRRALLTALVVGTVLTGINQSGTLMSGDATAITGLRIALTYCVPYCVSTYGGVAMALGGRHR